LIISTEENILRTLLATKGVATTVSGANWLVKALHPSDPSVYCEGIPDNSCLPTVVQNFQMTKVLSAPEATTPSDTWAFNSTLLPHPVNFMYWNALCGDTADSGTFLNSQLSGATHEEKFVTLKNIAQRWRLAYAAVTVYQDGPSLANQGEITVCQTSIAPRSCRAGGVNDMNDCMTCSVTLQQYSAEDVPQFETAVSCPNCYVARSKEGAYVPLRLTDTSQQWTSEEDDVALALLTTQSGAGDNAWYSLPVSTAAYANIDVFPHYTSEDGDLNPCYVEVSDTHIAHGLHGSRTSKMLSGAMAHICGRNISRQTSFQFVFRYGIEMLVAPGTLLSPQAKLSPLADYQAIHNYFRIARELKDAYPAAYNDLNKLWNVLSGVVKQITPIIRPFAPRLSLGLDAGVKAGNAIQGIVRSTRRKAKGKPKQKKKQQPPKKIQTVAKVDKKKDTAAMQKRVQTLNAAAQEPFYYSGI